VVTRAQVLELVGQGRSYELAGARLGITAGQAYMIATGFPADGSNALSPEDREREGVVADSTQRLSNPPVVSSTVSPEVLAWIKERAARDLTAGG
jgi:hypothetical protein